MFDNKIKAKYYIINMKNTLKLGGISCLGVACFASLFSAEENSTETSQVSYVQNSPIAEN